MPDYTFIVAAEVNDGYSRLDDAYFTNTNVALPIGYFTYPYGIFVRFTNVTIPKDAIITECYVKLFASNADSASTVNANIHFNTSDNAVAPTSCATYNALTLTDAIAWNAIGTWSGYVGYNTPSLTSIFQTIVNRAGWVSGNAAQVLIKNNSSTAQRRVCSYGSGAAYRAELHVSYSTGDNTGTVSVTLPSLTEVGYTGALADNYFPILVLTANTINVGTSDITFPSFVILSYVGAVGSIEIPVLSLDCTATNAVNNTEINFPSLEIESYTGVTGTITFPSLICTATTTYGVVELTFPSFIISSYTGAGSQLNLPVPTLVATVSNIAHGAISLPHLIGTSAAYHINLLEAMVLPKLTLFAQTGENAILQSSIPKLVLTAGTGAQGNIVLSNKFACVATGLSGTLATFSEKISKLNLTATCGSSGSLVLGDIEVIAHGTTGLVGKGVIRIPSLLFVGEGMQGNLCSCLITFPSLRFAAIGLREIIGVGSIITKSLVVYAHGFSGSIGTLIYELPLIELTSTVYRNSIGDSNIILPSIGLESIAETDGKYDSFILKYTR